VELHSCAPKAGLAEEWDTSFKTVVQTIHETADEIFRAVVESWKSSTGMKPSVSSKGNISDEPSRTQPDALGNPGWRGLSAGIEMMTQLLGLLRQYVATPTSAPVILRTGLVADLLTRMFLMTVPKAEEITHWQTLELYNKQVSKHEREELFNFLPRIHIAAMEVWLRLVQRLGSASIPLCSQFLSQLIWTFEVEHHDLFLRTSTYSALTEILKIVGPSIDISSSRLEVVVEHCTKDAVISNSIMTENEGRGTQNQRANGKMKMINPDMILDSASIRTSASTTYNRLQDTARQLLSTILSKVPADQIPQTIREKLDRAAVYSADTNSMIASVLNPPPLRSSILPIMARLHPEANEIEAILRPRMPAIVTEPTDTKLANNKDGSSLNNWETSNMDNMKESHMFAANNSHIGSEVDQNAFLSETQILTETTSFRTEQPSTHSTAELSAHTEPSDQMSALEAAIEAQSRLEPTKRSPEVDEENFSSAKRPRLEETDTMNANMRQQFASSVGVAVPLNAASSPIAGSTTLSYPVVATSSVEVGNENLTGVDSDDDTDGFEMPPLIFKSDDEEEDEV